MRLIIDLQAMQNGSRNRGIGRYVRSFAATAAQQMPPSDLLFIISDLFPETIEYVRNTLAEYTVPEQFVVFSGVGPTAELDSDNEWRRSASELLYEQFVASLAPDILLIGSFMEGAADNCIASFPPAPRGYSVGVILYDLIPLLDPDTHLRSEASRRWYDRKLARLKSVDCLLAISESARQEAILHANIDETKIVTIGSAASTEFENNADNVDDHGHWDMIRNYFGIDRPFIMHTSAFEARKNFTGLIRAFAQLRKDLRDNHQLVLVCKPNASQRYELHCLIKELGLGRDSVVFTGFVVDEELRLLYRKCALFVFPSFHEGFGLPALEAMWCGAPTIGSNRSSIPEVIGWQEALFDPSDDREMANLISRCLLPGPFRSQLIDHARRQCRLFDWKKTVELALGGLRELNSRPASDPSSVIGVDMLIDRVVEWDGDGGPTLADLASTARAIVHNNGMPR